MSAALRAGSTPPRDRTAPPPSAFGGRGRLLAALVLMLALPALVVTAAFVDAERRGGELVRARLEAGRQRAADAARARVVAAWREQAFGGRAGQGSDASAIAGRSSEEGLPALVVGPDGRPRPPALGAGSARDGRTVADVAAGVAGAPAARGGSTAASSPPTADATRAASALAAALVAESSDLARARDLFSDAVAQATSAGAPLVLAEARLGSFRIARRSGDRQAEVALARALLAEDSRARGPEGVPIAVAAALVAAPAAPPLERRALVIEAAVALATLALDTSVEDAVLAFYGERLAVVASGLDVDAGEDSGALRAAVAGLDRSLAWRRAVALFADEVAGRWPPSGEEAFTPLGQLDRWAVAARRDDGAFDVGFVDATALAAAAAPALDRAAEEHGFALALVPAGSDRPLAASKSGADTAAGSAAQAPAAPSARATLPGGATEVLVFDPDADTLAASERRRARAGLAALAGATAVALLASVYAVQALRQEARAARERADLVAAVTHQLRTPLTAIITQAELLQTRAPTAKGGAVILGEAVRLLRLVENVLSFARLERRGLARERLPEPVGPLVRECAEALRAVLDRDGLQLEVEVAEALPLASIDREAIRHALLNLIDNARVHAAEGRAITVEAGLEGDGRDRALVIAVLDRGPGIPAADRARVLEPFARGSSRKAGTGLGLAIASEVARAHGGLLRLSEREGGGARVALVIPLTASAGATG